MGGGGEEILAPPVATCMTGSANMWAVYGNYQTTTARGR